MRRSVSFALAVTLVATLAGQVPEFARAAAPMPQAKDVPSVAGKQWNGGGPAADTFASSTVRAPAVVSWPAASTADVSLSRANASPAKAGAAPVWIADRGGGLESARVEVLDRAATGKAGVHGLLMRVGAGRAGEVALRVDYRGFRNAYGGDWASRLRLARVPECRLSTPDAAGCAAVPVPSTNDPAAGVVSADVALDAAGTLVALLAAPSSDGGNYSAAPLEASSSWAAGNQSGDFTWSYPMRVPPGNSGPEPTIGLSYSAQSLDGRTAATNNQPSWAGDGFDYAAGSIDRGYKACADDGKTGIGDLCWGTDNANLSLPGHAGELIQTSTSPDVWRLKHDDGTKVERLAGAWNGAWQNQYWKVTTPDGTQYHFGLNRLPGSSDSQVTNSVFTVPVFGNNSGEPCYQSSGFNASWCNHAYKWNLDYVVDAHGNTMSLWYAKQNNQYARNVTATSVSTYTRGGHIEKIKYGTRQNAAGADEVFTVGAPAEVEFKTEDRCVTPGSTCVQSNKANWPDVPWDQQCDSTTRCTDIYAPTFFSSKRLASVTTRVRDGSGYRDVERWTLTHSFKDPGDSHPKLLWLDRISHAGLAGGQNTTTPDITFGSVPLNNRVDKNQSKAPIVRFRIASISNEVGGVTSVAYSQPECVTGSNMPAADNNSKRCFPVWWTPYNATAPTFDWFHKYVVTSVSVRDNAGGAPLVEYQYSYSSDGPMWHYDNTELIPVAHRSWGQWRGYSKVRTTAGDGSSPRMQSDTTYFRGMHGDKAAGNGTRSVSLPADPDVPGSAAVPDEDWLAGQPRTVIQYNGVGDSAPVVSKTVTDPWFHGPTASRDRNGVVVKAYMTGDKRTTTLTALDAGRGWRKSQTTNTYDTEDGSPDPAGLITRVEDAGDLSSTADDQCTRTTYARNTGKHILTAVSRVETVAVGCAATPSRPGDVVSDTRTWYDGAESFGTSITKGNVTRTETLNGWSGSTPIYLTAARSTYDDHGRVLDAFDALGRKTETRYVQAAGGLVTGTTTKNALGWLTTTAIDPAYGEPTSSVDINGKRTDVAYDGLGRITAVWKPGRAKGTDSPHLKYTYIQRNTGGPNAVGTETLNRDGTGYLTSWAIQDGLLRERQTQTPGANGGRVITDTLYDSRGLAVRQNQAYYNAGAPDSSLFVPTGAVPGSTVTAYDSAGRATVATFQINGVDQWSASTYDGGDHVDTTAVPGGTGTSVWTNARGQTTELREFKGRFPTGDYDVTRYTYTPSGEIETATDPALNVWSFKYDLRGNQIEARDPDKGTSTYTYNDLGQRLTVTDARGVTLTSEYDPALGRQTGLYQGTTKLASWTFDTLVKGQPTSSTRYVDGNAYVTAVTGYDDQYRSLGTSVTIPASETGLAGTYTTTSTFNADGSTATTTLPAAGGLPAETVTFGYNATGLSTTMSSALSTYVTGTWYDSLGRVGTRTLSNGGGKTLTQVWNYEAGTERLLEHGVYDDAADKVFQDNWYTYDPSGNVTSIKDKTAQYNAGPDDNQCFRFDHRRRLTEAWTPGNGDCAADPTQAALGGPVPYWTSYGYDKTGSRTTEIDRTKTTSVTRTSSYPAPGATSVRPHAVTQVAAGSGGTDTYAYDAAGNMTTRNRAGKPGQTLTWDAEGHLAAVTESGATTSYTYDATGARLISRDAEGKTLYLGGQEIRVTTAGAKTATREYGGFAARSTAGGLHWTVADHHGTNTLTFDADDLTVQQRRAKPFGASRGTDPPWITTKGFVGGTRDGTGLTHLGAREYDPALGRFISVDPIFEGTDPQSWNGYAYAHNNPVTISDPSGLADVWVLRARAYASWTKGNYRYYLRYSLYQLCRSNGSGCVYWDPKAGLYIRLLEVVEVARVWIAPSNFFGPVAPKVNRQKPYEPPAKCATRPDPPAAGIRAAPCGLFDVGCLKRNPKYYWQSNRGKIEGAVAVAGVAACLASAGAACAALAVAGAAMTSADRAYDFTKSGDHSVAAWGSLAAGLVWDVAGSKSGVSRIGLPLYAGKKTRGVLDDGTNLVPLVSGKKWGYSQHLPKGTPGFNGNVKWHVEGHAAAYMRLNGVQDATLYINRVPCNKASIGCQQMLPRMLPPGSNLRVRGPDDYDETFSGLPD